MAKRYNKKNDTLLTVIVAILVAIILGAGVLIIGYVSRDANGKWFANSDLASWHWSDKDKTKTESSGVVLDENGKQLLSDVTYAMPKSMAYLETSESEDAVGPMVTITAKQSMELNNVPVDWAVTYPSGADASDCVKVTPESDGSLTATLQYLKSFDKQLTLKVSVRGGSSSATCTIDCIKRIEQTDKYYLCGTDFGDSLDVGFTFSYGSGTITPDVNVKSATFSIASDFQTLVNRYLTFDVDFISHTQSYTNTKALTDGGVETADETPITYDMFIADWSNYDEAHQNAVKYAWYRAFSDFGTSNSNVLTDFDVDFTYKGYVIGGYQESDMIGFPVANSISGEYYGAELEPDLELNYNIVV